MQEKSISSRKIASSITSEDILGKDVIDSEGGFIGVTERIFIDPITLNGIGIAIDRGLMNKGLTIGKNYISRITNHAVFLKIRLVYELRGMIVFDKHGKRIGKVIDIDLYGNQNKIKRIYIKPGFLRETIAIPESYVKNIGDNIILNVPKSQLSKK